MDDVSPSTRRAIHHDDERSLRWATVRRSPFLIGALLLWLFGGGQVGSPLFFLVGVTALPLGAAAWAWWQHRCSDPLAIRVTETDAALAERAAIAERLASRRAYQTYALVGVLVIIGALQLLLTGSITRSIAAAGLVTPAVKAGEWWRLISATLAGSEMHSPPYSSLSRRAVSSHTAALRELMYTFAPLATNPAAIISPMPREPPVTSATLPSMPNSVSNLTTDLPTGSSQRAATYPARHRWSRPTRASRGRMHAAGLTGGH